MHLGRSDRRRRRRAVGDERRREAHGPWRTGRVAAAGAPPSGSGSAHAGGAQGRGEARRCVTPGATLSTASEPSSRFAAAVREEVESPWLAGAAVGAEGISAPRILRVERAHLPPPRRRGKRRVAGADWRLARPRPTIARAMASSARDAAEGHDGRRPGERRRRRAAIDASTAAARARTAPRPVQRCDGLERELLNIGARGPPPRGEHPAPNLEMRAGGRRPEADRRLDDVRGRRRRSRAARRARGRLGQLDRPWRVGARSKPPRSHGASPGGCRTSPAGRRSRRATTRSGRDLRASSWRPRRCSDRRHGHRAVRRQRPRFCDLRACEGAPRRATPRERPCARFGRLLGSLGVDVRRGVERGAPSHLRRASLTERTSASRRAVARAWTEPSCAAPDRRGGRAVPRRLREAHFRSGRPSGASGRTRARSCAPFRRPRT